MKNEKAEALGQRKGHGLHMKMQGQDEKQKLKFESEFQS